MAVREGVFLSSLFEDLAEHPDLCACGEAIDDGSVRSDGTHQELTGFTNPLGIEGGVLSRSQWLHWPTQVSEIWRHLPAWSIRQRSSTSLVRVVVDLGIAAKSEP